MPTLAWGEYREQLTTAWNARNLVRFVEEAFVTRILASTADDHEGVPRLYLTDKRKTLTNARGTKSLSRHSAVYEDTSSPVRSTSSNDIETHDMQEAVPKSNKA